VSRTWKDLRPDVRNTAQRFTARRADGGPRRDRGESYPMVARELRSRRSKRLEQAA